MIVVLGSNPLLLLTHGLPAAPPGHHVQVRMWEAVTVALADLGPVELDLNEDEAAAAMLTTAGGAAARESGAVAEQSSEEEQGLVEYEGMLVSVAAAQRRRFFSSLIQRAAKMHRRLRGGSLSLLLVVPGVPARGVRGALQGPHPHKDVLRYKHLSEAQKAKLLAALEVQTAGGAGSSIDGSASSGDEAGAGAGPAEVPGTGPREVRTEVVEELLSIADGQVVLMASRDPATGGVSVDPQLSLSRIGSRAYNAAMEALAPQVGGLGASLADWKILQLCSPVTVSAALTPLTLTGAGAAGAGSGGRRPALRQPRRPGSAACPAPRGGGGGRAAAAAAHGVPAGGSSGAPAGTEGGAAGGAAAGEGAPQAGPADGLGAPAGASCHA